MNNYTISKEDFVASKHIKVLAVVNYKKSLIMETTFVSDRYGLWPDTKFVVRNYKEPEGKQIVCISPELECAIEIYNAMND